MLYQITMNITQLKINLLKEENQEEAGIEV